MSCVVSKIKRDNNNNNNNNNNNECICKAQNKWSSDALHRRAGVESFQYFVPFLRYSTSKNGVTLKPGRSCSRSLKMAPFDSSYAIFYLSAIVNVALSCTVFELLDVE